MINNLVRFSHSFFCQTSRVEGRRIRVQESIIRKKRLRRWHRGQLPTRQSRERRKTLSRNRIFHFLFLRMNIYCHRRRLRCFARAENWIFFRRRSRSKEAPSFSRASCGTCLPTVVGCAIHQFRKYVALFDQSSVLAR